MKTQNLIKILALGAVALSLGACKKKKSSSEVAKVVEISELLALDPADSSKWELEGQLVKIEHVACGGKHGSVVYANASVGEKIVDLRGVEIRCKEAPAFVRSGYGADITAEGRVVNVNGRLTLQEAIVTVNSERGEDGKYAEGAGLPVHYCPALSDGSIVTDRSVWDGYFSGKIYSGACIEGLFQLATVPEARTAESGATSFYAAFPGEDLDAEDPDNFSLIKFNIPAASEMSEKALKSYNDYFSGKAKGDFVIINGLLEYDSVENGGMGFIVESYWNERGYTAVKDKDKPVIYNTWAAAAATQAGYYDGGFLDLAPTSEEDPLSAPFSVLVDESYLNNPKGKWNPTYVPQIIKIADEDLAKCASSVVTVNFKSSKFESYTDEVEKRLKAAGYELDESMAENGLYLFLLKDSTKVVKEVVMIPNNESQVEFQYIAPKAALDYATFAEFKAGFEAKASAKITALTEAAFTHTSALPEFTEAKKPANINMSWMYESDFDELYVDPTYIYMPYYSVEFNFADAAAASAGLADYKEKLAAASFEMKKLDLSPIGAIPMSGYFNATSKEIIVLGLSGKDIYADLLVLNDAAVAAFIKDLPHSDAELSAAYLADFATYGGYGYGKGTSKLPSSFTLGTNAANYWDNSTILSYMSAGTLIEELELRYDVTLTDEIVANFSSALTTAGFVAATFDNSAFGGSLQLTGVFHADSNEFVMLSADGNKLSIDVILVPDGYEAYFVTIL